MPPSPIFSPSRKWARVWTEPSPLTIRAGRVPQLRRVTHHGATGIQRGRGGRSGVNDACAPEPEADIAGRGGRCYALASPSEKERVMNRLAIAASGAFVVGLIC